MVGQTFRLGDRGPAIAEIRSSLGRLGCSDAVLEAPLPDLFDPPLAEAIRQFQQERGLLADGIVGPVTYRALEEARWRLGDRLLRYEPGHLIEGDDVMVLQSRLHELGFDVGRVDGEFGPLTQEGLREFQRNMGLPPDGTAGPSTLKVFRQLTPMVTGGRPDALRAVEARRAAGPRLRGKVVVIDPGSGGNGHDVVIDGLSAAELLSDVASRLEGRLAVSGVSVYRTNGPSQQPTKSLTDRARLANDVQANVFISLFVDTLANPEAAGVATYYYGRDPRTSSAEGEQVAALLQKEIVARTGVVDCRSHPKTWELLRRTQMPAVMVGLGYFSNDGDRRRLADSAFRDTVAEGMAAALQRLYLPEEADEDTGTLSLLAIDDVLRRQA